MPERYISRTELPRKAELFTNDFAPDYSAEARRFKTAEPTKPQQNEYGYFGKAIDYVEDKVSGIKDKVEEKVENKSSEQKSELENEQTGQHSQNQNGQQDANQQTTELSDEILSVIKANKGNLSGGVNHFKIISGISEDVFTSPAKIDYSSFAMSNEDALFFANLVSKTEMNMQSVAGEFQKSLQAGKVEQVQKTAQVSSVLLEALSESMKTNKAFRIDFDNDVSVVLRVDRDGNLNANFIPGDKAVEAYLRNNIPYLKQRFEEQNLSYGELTYSKHKRQDQDDEKQNNKENSHE